MAKVKYEIIEKEDGVRISLTPIVAKKKQDFFIPRRNGQVVRFFTATTLMKDFIGNVVDLYGDRCSVQGVIYGKDRKIPNVRILDPRINRKGQRVMITEHVRVDGKFELVATKERILEGDINFLNVGWTTDKESRYLRIDVYTGESRNILGAPVRV